MTTFKHHKYTWTCPFGNVYHDWQLVGDIGALNFHISISPKHQYPPSAGLEFHHTDVCQYRANTAPDHVNCPLTGGRCWHDGTSMYATETLWPMIEPLLKAGEHRQIFALLEGEFEQHFEPYRGKQKT